MSVPASGHRILETSRARVGVAEGVLWFTALALLWTLLNPGDRASWLVGLPVISLATWFALKLHRPPASRISLQGLVRFILFFIWHSVRGGWDVARRALHPRLPLNPELVRFRTCLPDGPARILFLNITSLLPGTLSAGVDDDVLLLHVLDAQPGALEEMQALEARVADLFALEPTEQGRIVS